MMEHRELQQDLEDQWGQVVSRLQGKVFQSDWDIASFTVFFIFIGMVLLLVLLVLIRCCCCCCCSDDEKVTHTHTHQRTEGTHMCCGEVMAEIKNRKGKRFSKISQ
ncbi:small integral membrane protein 22 isoform X3 [Gymnodraco acuticeps]|uniref:Small integral membrane protein 22 isoform X3 n=1 Tax=Gymnodraco acuticeps TaxID=8218 RepID=A0A6P8UPU8_GYMAC|nr:small integral membrane protein 22 isoform X3 [Gymnodraco acuticeps]